MRHDAVGLAMILAAAAAAPRAAAGDGFDVQLFQPATSSAGFFSVATAQTLALRRLDVGIAFDWARDVLVARDPDTGEPLTGGEVVSGRLASQIAVGYGVHRLVELGLAVPVVLMQDGDLAQLRPGDNLAGAALGDLRLFGKVRLAGGELAGGRLDLAAALDVTLPSGAPGNFSGDGKVGGRPMAVLGWTGEHAGAAVNVGYRMRGRSQVANVVVDDELTAGAAASVEAVPARVWLLGEAYLATGLNGGAHDTPIETIVGGRFAVAGKWTAQAGIGFGLTRGYGAPSLRGVIGLGYSADLGGGGGGVPRLAVPLPAPETDLGDASEAPGAVPQGADRDHDGLPDDQDRCPDQPENVNGTEDSDGCPDTAVAAVDSDGDGVADGRDRCPAEPEDADGVEDDDGCPDLDDDGDGIPDSVDACPAAAEVFNGRDDDDGCPDAGAALAELGAERITLPQPVQFEPRKARLRRGSQKALQIVAKLLLLHPEIAKVRIEGYVDVEPGHGTSLSKARAEAVRHYLVGQGVEEERLEAVGHGADQPIEDPTTPAGRQKNQRIEFVIIQHE